MKRICIIGSGYVGTSIACLLSSKNIVLIEEFIDGKQISSESVVYKSNVTTPGFSDRNYENISQSRSNVIENGGDLPTQIDEKTKIKILKLII